STGNLKFSGSANLLAITNPLASASVPLMGALGVSQGASVTVGADFQLSGDYQLRIHRMSGMSFRMGFYRKRGSQFDLSANAQISMSAKLGDNDLFVKLMQAISSDASADLKQLEAAGLSESQSKGIQTAIKNAVDRSLAIGVSLELSRTDESEAVFLYEVDLDTLPA